MFQLDTPVELKMYSLVTGFRLDVLDKWILYGAASKDEPWVQLDARYEFPKPVTNFTEKAFSIGVPGAYRFYRFNWRYTSCYGCGRCKGDEGYTYVYPDGKKFFRCGGELIELAPIGTEHVAEILAMMKAQDDFWMKKIEGWAK